MDWKALTEGWVEEALITEAQRGPLLQRLEAIELPKSSLPLGPLMTVLVAPAAFLMVGSVVALLAAVLDPPKAVYDMVIGGSGGLMSALGLAMRFVPSVRPLARGLMAAAIPMLTYAVGSSAGDTGIDPLLTLPLIPALLGWAIGLAENSRAVTAVASVVSVLALWTAVAANDIGLATLAIAVCAVVVLGVLTAATRLVESRAAVWPIGSPSVVMVGASMLVVNDVVLRPIWDSLQVSDPWSLEKGLFWLAYGAVVLVMGLIGRTGWTLVPGVGLIATSTVWIAFTVGSFVGGAVALGLVSLALFIGAMLLWILPTLRN